MGNSLSILDFPSETIREILGNTDLSSFMNLLSVSKRIFQISSSVYTSHAAHISSEHVESPTIVNLMKNLSRYVKAHQCIPKYLCLKPTRQVPISKDFPIGILMISSLEKLGEHEATNFDQVAILILSLRKEDEESISQYKHFVSSRRFPILKTVIINDQSFAGRYGFSNFMD